MLVPEKPLLPADPHLPPSGSRFEDDFSPSAPHYGSLQTLTPTVAATQRPASLAAPTAASREPPSPALLADFDPLLKAPPATARTAQVRY